MRQVLEQRHQGLLIGVADDGALSRNVQRRPHGKWESRPIDLDLLLFGSEVIHTGELVVPHPQMHTAGFKNAGSGGITRIVMEEFGQRLRLVLESFRLAVGISMDIVLRNYLYPRIPLDSAADR